MAWTEERLRKHRFIFVIVFLMLFAVFSLHFEAEERRESVGGKGEWKEARVHTTQCDRDRYTTCSFIQGVSTGEVFVLDSIMLSGFGSLNIGTSDNKQ
jgi:hypothetical protein